MIIACNKLVHISKREIENIDITIAKTMVLLIKKYIAEKKTYSDYGLEIPDEDVSLVVRGSSNSDKWKWVLGEILWAFAYIANDPAGSGATSHKSGLKRKKRGLELFAKYISSLWI